MIELEKYRDPILAKNIQSGEFIGFYPREFFCFDNFSAFKLFYDGVLFTTVEHAYQAYKFKQTAPEIFWEIVECYSSDEARRIALRHTDKIPADWHQKKVALMEELLRAKLAQNPFVKEKLLQTGEYRICEDSPVDGFWGTGKDGKGRNELGKLWMKLRAELREKENGNEV